MSERNIIVYIQDLDISDRGKHALLRMKIMTLNELEKRSGEDIYAVPGIGDDVVQELLNVLEHIEEIFARFEARKQRIDEIKDFDVDDITFSNRALNSLKRAKIFKVGDMIRMSQKDIMGLRNVGVLTRDDITAAINAIIAEGSDYFLHPHLVTNADNRTDDSTSNEERDARIADRRSW